MKNTMKFLSIISLVAVVGVTFAACGGNEDGDNTGKTPDNKGVTSFSVTYDVGNGSGTAPQRQSASAGESIYLPGQENMVSPDGYYFSGWRTSGVNYQAGDSFTVKQDVIFIAQWSINENPNNNNFVAVTSITGIPTSGTVGTSFLLNGTVNPSTATNKMIVWTVQNGNATINGNILSAVTNGIVTIRATIVNGLEQGSNYTQNFAINFSFGAISKSDFYGVWVRGDETYYITETDITISDPYHNLRLDIDFATPINNTYNYDSTYPSGFRFTGKVVAFNNYVNVKVGDYITRALLLSTDMKSFIILDDAYNKIYTKQ